MEEEQTWEVVTIKGHKDTADGRSYLCEWKMAGENSTGWGFIESGDMVDAYNKRVKDAKAKNGRKRRKRGPGPGAQGGLQKKKLPVVG
jgi:hypothetical protein